MQKRRTTLPIRTFKLTMTPRCVGCQKEVLPGFCRTGSIAQGIGFATVKSKPVLISLTPTSYAETTRNVAFVERKKGYICSDCAANYHTYHDHKGVSHPVVMTDPTPGFLGQTVSGHGIKSDGMGSVDD